MTRFFREAGVITATTIGAGMFGLPYIFFKSGWMVGIFYLFVLSFIVAGSHILYWRTLARADEKRRLLGMARDFLGKFWYRMGLFSVLAGLILALVIYLILGTSFIRLFWPSAGDGVGLFMFWLVSIAPLFFERRVVGLELAGIVFMAGIILLIFFSAPQFLPQVSVPAIDFGNFFLPFGVVLFSLAGWTAIEPLFAERKRAQETSDKRQAGAEGEGGYFPRKPFFAGTFAAAGLYVLFVVGILGSTAIIAPDAISGLAAWPEWKLGALGVLGIFALWTSYMPIGLEIKNSLTKDLGWKSHWGLALTVFLPPLLVLSGFSNFLKVIGLAGGVFLALQYVLIVLVGKRVLGLSGVEKFFYNLVIAAFLLAAVYEFYYFIVG
ncbi:MAG: aromatic amino acid transport family protein [Patescibacteria group bacterium]